MLSSWQTWFMQFQSTHPVRGATRVQVPRLALRHVSIHAPRAGCDDARGARDAPDLVSIHAPRAGCDRVHRCKRPCVLLVSIHAPRAGCDVTRRHQRTKPLSFQSTHPVRGATRGHPHSGGRVCCFNPRTPCGVRHAALEVPAPEILVSIHAPRAGCDPWTSTTTTDTAGFNPRTPCGVRPQKVENIACYFKFQSTHPVRGATGPSIARCSVFTWFQSTHPVRGATRPSSPRRNTAHRFQSTHPVRGATRREGRGAGAVLVSIHAPRAGCDGIRRPRLASPSSFNPRTPCGVRPRS